jgi:hypothetical protein
MKRKEKEDSTLHELNALVLDPALPKLERLLSQFSLFRLLRSEDGELCHSNVIAWLLGPPETHGFRDLFLRRWLMRVLHDSRRSELADLPARLDSIVPHRVAIRREWPAGTGYLDILIRLTTLEGAEWIIAVENKINAPQGPVQLKAYRKSVEAAFPGAQKHVFIFLSRRRQKPADAAWIEADYRQLAIELEHAMNASNQGMDADAASFLRQYARTLKDTSMTNKEVTELAKIIYRTHKRAIDTILEHKPDFVSEITETVAASLEREAKGLNLVPRLSAGSYVRFMPEEWDIPENRAGNAWGDDSESAYVLCQLSLGENSMPRLHIVEGGWMSDQKAPVSWRKKLWMLAQREGWKRKGGQEPPKGWTHLFSVEADFSLGDETSGSVDVQAQKVWAWLKAEVKKPEFRSATARIVELVKELP